MENQIIRIAVVEDSQEDMDNCLSLLNKYGKEKKLDLNIETFNSGDAFLIHYKNQYDFIILDINLSLTNGIAVAKQIREKEDNVDGLITYKYGPNFRKGNYPDKPGQVKFSKIVNHNLQNLKENFVIQEY